MTQNDTTARTSVYYVFAVVHTERNAGTTPQTETQHIMPHITSAIAFPMSPVSLYTLATTNRRFLLLSSWGGIVWSGLPYVPANQNELFHQYRPVADPARGRGPWSPGGGVTIFSSVY